MAIYLEGRIWALGRHRICLSATATGLVILKDICNSNLESEEMILFETVKLNVCICCAVI